MQADEELCDVDRVQVGTVIQPAEKLQVGNGQQAGEVMQVVEEVQASNRMQTGEVIQAGESLQAGDTLQMGEVPCAGDVVQISYLEQVEEFPEMTEEKEHTATCGTCKVMKSEISQLKGKVTRLKNKLAYNQEHWVQTFRDTQEQNRMFMVNTGKTIMVAHMIGSTDVRVITPRPGLTWLFETRLIKD
ncbi:hypothetical protein OS493_039258 [Desmophyllum pertusum]|uniref:Uncharacterized protein n=1 Tax=Desmophyllum pertusum TaxID=174260 RepID=A0A9W9ZIS7_9CNID|nr:hypothetical protein OS493_039258 [Desmophyllum pertusum]